MVWQAVGLMPSTVFGSERRLARAIVDRPPFTRPHVGSHRVSIDSHAAAVGTLRHRIFAVLVVLSKVTN